jgi:acetyl esterase/lipase
LGEEDGRQAIRLVRSRAVGWGIDPQRIGIMGFSAGGSVSFAAATAFDDLSRPDFAAPIYGLPADDYVVPADAPPLFIALAEDDHLVPAAVSVKAWQAWTAAGCSAELHVFRTGGHGFGMKHRGLATDAWTELFATWLRGLGLLARAG